MATGIVVSDQTLRDGEQQVGVFFSPQEKIELATAMSGAGVTTIALMPATSSEEEATVSRLLALGIPVVPDIPIGKENIVQANSLGALHITLFAAVSDILLSTRKLSLEANLENILQASELAVKLGMRVDVALEDASRGDMGYLLEVAGALRSTIATLVVCDTVGCMQPNLVRLWIDTILSKSSCRVGIHCHNDLGLAVDNTIAAVQAGATLVSGTMTGIGERAGNAALERVVELLLRDQAYDLARIDLPKIKGICNMVRKTTRQRPPTPLSRRATYTQTGIHVHAMLQNPMAYSFLPGTRPVVWFGKYSGASNYKWLFEHVHNEPLSEDMYDIMRDKVKLLSQRFRKTYSAEEVMTMYRNGHF